MGLVDKIKQFNRKRQIEKVKTNPSYIAYKKNPDEELQLIAVDCYDYIIQYFPNASIKVQHYQDFPKGKKTISDKMVLTPTIRGIENFQRGKK